MQRPSPVANKVASSTPPVITCHQLSRRFGSTHAIQNLSMSLDAGKSYALVGANGSGKSTLMRLFMRMLTPTSGDASVLGVPLSRDTGEVNARIGWVSEDLKLALPLSLGKFSQLMQRSLPVWDNDHFLSLMDQMQLSLAKNWRELSRGQRMRYFFALAMARRPDLILLDEVGSVMDNNARRIVHETLRQHVQRGATVLMATNIPAEIAPDVDAVILLKSGNVQRIEHFARFRSSHQKIRLRHQESPPEGCWPCGRSSDGRQSCIVPIDHQQSGHPQGQSWELDRRALTPEDMVEWLMQTAVRP